MLPLQLEAYCMTPDDPLRLWVQYCFTTSQSFMVPSQPPAGHHKHKQHLSGHGNMDKTDACWIKIVFPPKTTDLWPGGWRLNQRPCWQQEQCEWPSTSDCTEPASSPTASAAELGQLLPAAVVGHRAEEDTRLKSSFTNLNNDPVHLRYRQFYLIITAQCKRCNVFLIILKLQ